MGASGSKPLWCYGLQKPALPIWEALAVAVREILLQRTGKRKKQAGASRRELRSGSGAVVRRR